MSLGDTPYSLDADYSSTSGDVASASGRIGVAPLATQAGKPALFKGPTGLFSLASVDGNGNLQTLPVNPAGGSLQVYSGQQAPAAASQFGQLSLGRQTLGAAASYQPLALDSQGGLITSNGPRPSFKATITGVACTQGKVLLSLMNAGSNYIRIAAINVYVPSLSTLSLNGGSVLGLSGTTTTTAYYPLFCELYRITTHGKGTGTTTLAPVACDTSDSIDTAVTVYSASTISASTGLLQRRDALQCANTGGEFYRVICGTEKNLLCRPGEGIGLVCVSNGNIAANASNGVTQASVDVQVTFTQAAA